MRKLFYLLQLFRESSTHHIPILNGPFQETEVEKERNRMRNSDPDTEVIICEISYDYPTDKDTYIPVLNTSNPKE